MTNTMRTQPVRRLLRRGLSIALAVMLILTAMPAALAAAGDLQSVTASPKTVNLTVGGSSIVVTADVTYENNTIVNPAVVTATTDTDAVSVSKKSDTEFTLTPLHAGGAIVTLTARQSGGIERSDTVTVTVAAAPVTPDPPEPPIPDAVTGVNIHPLNLTLELDVVPAAIPFTIETTGNPTGIVYTLVSTNPSVVSVGSVDATNKNFTVDLHSEGTAVVELTASFGGVDRTDTCAITVVDSTPAPTPVPPPIVPESVSFATSTLEIVIPHLELSETTAVGYTIYPANVAPAFVGVTFASSSAAVVSVPVPPTGSGQTGTVLLTAHAPGDAVITVTTSNGKTGTIAVHVRNEIIPATGIWLGSENVTMNPGDTRVVSAGILPTDYNTPAAADLDLIAEISNPAVVEVDINQTTRAITLEAVGLGSATVTLSTSNGLPTKTINVLVLDDFVPATGATFSPSPVNITIPYEEYSAGVTVLYSLSGPAGMDDEVDSVHSDDLGVVEAVEGNAGEIVLTAYKAGSATVSVLTEGGFLTSFEVKVVKAPGEPEYLEPEEIEPEAPVVHVFKGDTASVMFEVFGMSEMSDAQISVASTTGNSAPVIDGFEDGEPAGEGPGSPALVYVNVLGLSAGSDLIELTVNGITGSVPVNIYDKIFQADVSISPASKIVESGDTAAFQLAGLDGLSTYGYTFEWELGTPVPAIPANGVWINGNDAGTSVEVGTSAAWYGSVPVMLTVTPPEYPLLNGSEDIPEFTLTALLEAHREGDLVLVMDSTVIATVQKLVVGTGKFIPTTLTPAFVLKCWNDGVLANVANPQFEYTSSNSAVCSVVTNGYLTPHAPGSATITVEGYDQLDPEKAPGVCTFDVVVYKLTAPAALETRVGTLLTLPGVLEPSGYIFYKITDPATPPAGTYVSENVFYTEDAGNYKVTAYAYPSYEAYLADLPLNAAPLTKRTILVRASNEPTWLTMNTTPIDLDLGETIVVDPTKAPYNAIYDVLTHGVITGWVSANPSALGVAGDVITGLAECASQYVYANTANGYRLYFVFNVNVVHVASVTITLAGETTPAGDAKMLVGELRQFAAAILPTTADDQSVIWSTGDASVATVDQLGNVTAVAVGTTILYATSPDGPADSIILTVVQQPSGIVLSNTYLEGYPGESLPLTYQVLPEGAVVHHIDWKYNPALTGAQWIEGLLVLPASVAPGDYTITVELYGPGYDALGDPTDEALLGTDQCLLRVLQPVTSVKLANIGGTAYGASDTIKGVMGGSIIVRANILPASAVDKTLVWDVEDDNVATVEPLSPLGVYARVTFVAPGSTNLIVKSAISDASDSILVQVVKPVTDFALTPNYKELYPGESFTYDVTLVPSDTMLINKIEFTSGDPTVATVDAYGRVTAILPSADSVEITAKYDNGLYTFEIPATVVVKNPVDKLEFVPNTPLNLTVGAGSELYSKLKFTGLNALIPVADKKVTWAVDDSGVLSVDANGNVLAKAVGNTYVYAYAHNGVFAKLLVSVQQNTLGLTLDAYDIAIRPNEVATIHAIVTPPDSTDVLEWELESGQTKVTMTNFDSRSFSLRGLEPGTTTLTATTYDVVSHTQTAQKVCTIIVKQPVTSIEVSSVLPLAVGASFPKTVTATHVGQLIALVANVLPADAYDKSVTWSVVDTNVATIDPITGVLNAAGVGTTVAMARSNSDPSVVGLINVVVVRGLLTLSVDPDEKSIYVGDRFTITPSLLPEGSVMPPVTYEATNDASSVTLTPSTVNGVPVCKVTGAAAGKATVTAYIFKGTADEVSATCQVEVLVPLTKFTVKKDRIRMLVGDAFRYDLADDLLFNDPLVEATQPKDKTAVYTSNDPTIASVDSYGQITAKMVGTTVINIVPNANPALRAQVTVEVVDLATGVIADAAEIRVYKGQKIPVGFTFVPEEIATTDFEWTYFDEDGNPLLPADGEDIAYYKDGFVYTVTPGFVKLVATVEIPLDIQDLYAKYPSLQFKEVKTSILVTVLTPVESIAIDSLDGVQAASPSELDTLTYHVGERFVLGASVLPADASDPEIFWTTSDSNIASVDAFGIVSANGTGTAKIYATSKNSGAQDSVTLTVEKAPYAKRLGAATVSGLYVRNKPSLQGNVYTQFKKNTVVTIVGEYGEWYEILYAKSPTGLAYVHKYYIRITGYLDPLPLEAPGDILTESNATINTKTTVWASAGSGYRTTAPAGTRVLVVGSSGSYYSITYGHYNLGTGYVLASRVTKDADFPKGKIIKDVPNGTGGYDSFLIDPGTGAAVPLVGETQVVNIPSSVTATSAPIYSGFDPATRVLLGRVYKGASLTIISEKLNGFYQVRLASGIVGWVEATFLAQVSSGGIETTVSVTILVGKATTNVTIRAGASTSTGKLGVLKKNQYIQLVSATKYNGFYRVVTSWGAGGYIMAKYLKVSSLVKQETTVTPIFDQHGVVNCKLLNVRETAAMDGVIIGTLSANQQVTILDELNGWYHVERADGSLGFVKTEFITLIEA